MDKILDQRITTKLSLAIYLRDDFTNREIIGDVKVIIPELELVAIENPSSYYNFLDIPDDAYTLKINSDYYLNEKVDINPPLYTIRNPLRFDHNSNTPLRKLIFSTDKNTQIAYTATSANDISIYLTNITASIQVGDVYMIMEQNPSRIEFCEIASVPADPNIEPFFLTLPLRFNHPKGTLLKKLVPDFEIAEINGNSSLVKANDLEVSLKNIVDIIIVDIINIKDIFKIEDSDSSKIEFFQIMAPMTKITLRPNHFYQFPFGTTLIRGEVKDLAGNPIIGADIKVAGKIINSRTTKNGDFVLYFPASHENALIQIDITPAGSPTKTVNSEVRKGRTTSLPVTYP